MQAFFCSICYEKHSLEDLFIVESCEHELCRGTARMTALSAIRNGTVPIGCPICKAVRCAKCSRQAFSTPETPYCFLSETDLSLLLTEEEMFQYRQATINKVVRTSDGHLVKCSFYGCNAVYDISDRVDTRVDCTSCGLSSCSNCGGEWHEGLTCEENQVVLIDDDAEEHINILKESGLVKLCPSCGSYGEKESWDECNCVRCVNCEKYFCWLCQKSLDIYSDPHSHYSESGSCYGKCFEGLSGH